MWLFYRELKTSNKKFVKYFMIYAAVLTISMIVVFLLQKTVRFSIGTWLEQWINEWYEPPKYLFGICQTIKLQSNLSILSLCTVPLLFLFCHHAFSTMAGRVKEEEQMGTIVFLMAQRIKRSQLLFVKCMTQLLSLFVLNLAMWFVSSILALIDSGAPGHGMEIIRNMFFVWCGMFFLQVLFSCFGMLYGVLKNKPVRVSDAAFNLVLLEMLLAVVYNVAAALSVVDLTRLKEQNGILNIFLWLRGEKVMQVIHSISMISPFRWFFPTNVVQSGINISFLLITLFVSAVCTALAMYSYEKKNLIACSL